MIPNGAWLNAGAAVVDGDGRIVESNDEFAFWAGAARLHGALLVDLLAQRCPEWTAQIQTLLGSSNVFVTANLEDSSIEPSHWYVLEIAHCGNCRLIRISRSLPPARELTEGAWDKFLNEEGPRRELYARMLRAEGQLELLSGKWPGVLFSQPPI